MARNRPTLRILDRLRAPNKTSALASRPARRAVPRKSLKLCALSLGCMHKQSRPRPGGFSCAFLLSPCYSFCCGGVGILQRRSAIDLSVASRLPRGSRLPAPALLRTAPDANSVPGPAPACLLLPGCGGRWRSFLANARDLPGNFHVRFVDTEGSQLLGILVTDALPLFATQMLEPSKATPNGL